MTNISEVSVQDLHEMVNGLQREEFVVASVNAHDKVQGCISADGWEAGEFSR